MPWISKPVAVVLKANKQKVFSDKEDVVLIAVLFIPFMYSFFYLKAYWNPYGKGNIDNLPVGKSELKNLIEDSSVTRLTNDLSNYTLTNLDKIVQLLS